MSEREVIIKAILATVQAYGEGTYESAVGETGVDELLGEFVDKSILLRNKYGVKLNAKTLDADTEDDNSYYDTLNSLLDKYRLAIFNQIMEELTDQANQVAEIWDLGEESARKKGEPPLMFDIKLKPNFGP